MKIESIIQAEGLSQPQLLPGILKGNELLNASEYLFKFLLTDSDPRWPVVAAYNQAKQQMRFKPVSFECALSAVYLSSIPSFRNGYARFNSSHTLRQLCRAVVNIAAYPELLNGFQQTIADSRLPEGLSFEFARTERILSGTDRRGITGCPEALYQLRLFCETPKDSGKFSKYLGRVGFNVHKEAGSRIISFTNLQGIPCGSECYHCFAQKFGISFFNTLITEAKELVGKSYPVAILKALRNPVHQESSPLYNTTFKAEGIKRVHFAKIA